MLIKFGFEKNGKCRWKFSRNRWPVPILRWGSTLDKPVSLIILPLFAFLNAGGMLPTAIPRVADALITLAILLALVLGKGIGISLFAWLGLKMGLVRLPLVCAFLK
jgi:NhaA family Na+:H+ antiporter